VFWACYLALPVIVMAMSIRTATTDKSKSSFPRVPSYGAAGCGGLGSRGEFLFGGGYMQFDAVRKFLMSELGLFLQAIVGLVVLHYFCGFEVAVLIALAFK
jgi:hypothetical protein